MNYLAIDTSGKNLTILICKDGVPYWYFDSECGVNHSVNLMPKLERLCLEHDFDLKKADFFSAVVGAGSFTGIRIGVSTVKALCFAFNKPCLSITSFDTLAYNINSGKVLAVIDAKHNGFYVCGYENGKVIYPPNYILKDQLLELATDYTVVSLDDIQDLTVQKVDILQGLQIAIRENLDKVTSDIESLNPLYVRKSQAEEGR